MDKDLVPNMMKANSGGLLGAVEGVSCHHFFHVQAERFPVIGLGNDVFGQALCHKAPVAFLRDFEDNLVHADQITALELYPQGHSGQPSRCR